MLRPIFRHSLPITLLFGLLGAQPEGAAAWAPPPAQIQEEPAFCEAVLPPPQPCDDGDTALVRVTEEYAQKVTAARIGYNSQPLSDCSGMAHRMLNQLANRCDNVVKPTIHQARSSAAIAMWYEGKGRLKRVKTLEDADSTLAPGMLAFYGSPGSRSKALNTVHHVGTVLSVERDEQGRVLSYRLFHGRSQGIPANITEHHTRDRSPALGNGREPLVALAWPIDGLLPETPRDPGLWLAEEAPESTVAPIEEG